MCTDSKMHYIWDMNIKITIEKGSKAAEAIKAFMKQKEEFHKAVESGRVEEYAKKNCVRFSQPV